MTDRELLRKENREQANFILVQACEISNLKIQIREAYRAFAPALSAKYE